MVRTKSAFDPIEESDGKRYLVMRYWPRRKGCTKERLGVSEWLRELAPSPDLLHDWRAGRITWDES